MVPLAMIEFLRNLFTADFMPHGRCMFWDPGVIWLHAVSDAVTALAYFSIPPILVYFTLKRKSTAWRWVDRKSVV